MRHAAFRRLSGRAFGESGLRGFANRYCPPGAGRIDSGMREVPHGQRDFGRGKAAILMRPSGHVGGDLAGMSTALEAIAAREAGAEVLGLSLVTNAAAGMTGEPLNHEEVLAAGQAAATRMGALLADVVSRL